MVLNTCRRPGPDKEPVLLDSSPTVFGERRQGRPLGRGVVAFMRRRLKLWQRVHDPLVGVPSLTLSLGIGLGLDLRLRPRLLVSALVVLVSPLPEYFALSSSYS